MNILSVIETLDPDGAETVLVDLALGLAEHSHRMVHFSTANGRVPYRPFIDALERAGIPTADVHWGALNDARERRRILDGFTPDVVLFHWWGMDPCRWWLRAIADAPLGKRPTFVCVLHRSGVPAPVGYDHYVLVTRTQRGQVAHVAPERVHLIANGVDLRRFSPVAPRRAPHGEVVIGRVSSLREGKIPADWVRTAASYGIPRTRWVMAGAGSLRARLQRDVEELGLERSFSLPGHVPRPDVPRLLSGFDVFAYVTSTAVECHPLALLEALAAGVPIVAEARGGVPEIVRHGANGLLARSADEIGEHVSRLAHDHELRARLARGARRSAEGFSLERQLRGYRRLLASAARERESPRARS
jgi:glycosyltransferase involved in cell wall biosynthesis